MIEPRGAGDPAPGFPLKVGVADVGSNAIRLMVADFIGPTTWEELMYERLPVRLGHGVYRTGRLDPAAAEGAVRAIARFREAIDEMEVPLHRAVATSAIRESEDGPELLRRIADETGVRVEKISGAEEIRLVYWASRDRLGIDSKPWILSDLGGGSFEVALVDGNGLVAAESHAIGSVRLYEELENAARDLDQFRTLLDEYLDAMRIVTFERPPEIAGFAATGGNIEDLATLSGAETDENGVALLPLARLDSTTERLAAMTVEKRIEDLGLREDRADVIVPAAIAYARLARMAGVDTIHVPRTGVKEGVMIDLVHKTTSRTGYTARHAADTRAGAVALGRRFGFDEAHALHVADLAEHLFDQLDPMHGLEPGDRELLAAAALLHDIGMRIAYPKHHKHSYYLISSSELPGFSPREVEIVANTARYHRKAHPKEKHEAFATLDEDDRKTVTRLAALLRIADALDREHRQRILDVAVRQEDEAIVLVLTGEGNLALERWAVEKKSDLFQKTFRLAVRTEEAP